MSKKIWDTWTKEDIYQTLEGKEDSRGFNSFMQVGEKFLEDFTNRYCVYMLCDNKEDNDNYVVYVGQTKTLIRRISEHKLKGLKEFTGVKWMYVHKDEVDFVEFLFINLYDPKYNNRLGRTAGSKYSKEFDRYLSGGWLQRDFSTEEDARRIKSIFMHNAFDDMFDEPVKQESYQDA